MDFPPILLRIAGLPVNLLTTLNYLPEENQLITEEDWDELYYQTVMELCKIADHPGLLNGLQMTSHSLAGRIEKIVSNLPPVLRKKEQQTARSLWQIVSRMAGKTSPFSSFTHLGRLDKMEENPGSVSHRFRLNNILLGQLLEILCYHPPYFRHQKISLNYTTKLKGTEYVFLHNTRNLESVQRIEQQPVIRLIVELLQDRPPLLFQELVANILAAAEADKTEIENYLFSLAEYGFLIWELPVSPTADNWWTPLSGKLLDFSDDPLCRQLGKILSDIETVLDGLSSKTPGERAAIQRNYFFIFKKIWEENKFLIPTQDSESVMEQGLKQITDKTFLLKPETLFYEDTRLRIKQYWNENNWTPLRQKMQTLSGLLKPLTPSPMSGKLLDFYQNNFNQPVSLWTFYQRWLPLAQAMRKAKNTKISKIELTLKKRLATLPRSASSVHLPPEFLRSLSLGSTPAKSYGSLVFPFRKNGIDQLFLDVFVPANARLAGRFLPLFSAADTKAWHDFHQSQAADRQWIENEDFSFFNANVHPRLLAGSLKIPSVSVAGVEQGIPITEIMVRTNPGNTCLVLTHEGQAIEVINLSLEAIDNRSGLYQLLCQLEAPVPSKNLLLKNINFLIPPTKGGIIKYPRVVYDQQIILQRATWFFPKGKFPLKAKGSSSPDYLKQLSTWQESNGLPRQFYYVLNSDYRATGTQTGRNQHKPQFFDFRNPLSVDLFHRDLKKVTHYLKVEEMLPSPDQLIPLDGVVRMAEGLVIF